MYLLKFLYVSYILYVYKVEAYVKLLPLPTEKSFIRSTFGWLYACHYLEYIWFWLYSVLHHAYMYNILPCKYTIQYCTVTIYTDFYIYLQIHFQRWFYIFCRSFGKIIWFCYMKQKIIVFREFFSRFTPNCSNFLKTHDCIHTLVIGQWIVRNRVVLKTFISQECILIIRLNMAFIFNPSNALCSQSSYI